jgi:uncharacterized protein (TIGR02679 family)
MSPLPGWIADPVLRPSWDKVRARFEVAGLTTDGRVRLTVDTRAERHAVGGLLGRTITRPRVDVDLRALDERLRARSGVGGLHAVLTALYGDPPRDRPAARAAHDASRERPLALATALVAAPGCRPWGDEWVAGLRRSGLLTNRADAERTVRDAVVVLSELTGTGRHPGPQSRVEIGARLVGDAHALDRDRLLHGVVLRGLAAAAGEPVAEGARDRERLWARFGVEPDLLSRTCLVWRLRLANSAPAARRLRDAADAGDPIHLTERDLRGIGPFTVAAGTRVLVCENPRVVEALAERDVVGWGAVCTAGEPNLVVDRVLRELADAGAQLQYHGDFDWPGIAIANRVVAGCGARPWRMTADDYLRSVRSEAPPLVGAAVAPVWDPELGAAMRAHGRAVHEESVLPRLLDELAAEAVEAPP